MREKTMTVSHYLSAGLCAASLIALAGCDEARAPVVAENDAELAAPEVTGEVIREEMATPEQEAAEVVAAQQASAATPIQTQPGPNGVNIALDSVKVTGDVMTVQLRTLAPFLKCCESELIDVNDVTVVDDATAQQMGVLKDNQGKYFAAPLMMKGSEKIRVELHNQNVFWFKFPAPPETSQTVSINIPTIAPFDGVTVSR